MQHTYDYPDTPEGREARKADARIERLERNDRERNADAFVEAVRDLHKACLAVDDAWGHLDVDLETAASAFYPSFLPDFTELAPAVLAWLEGMGGDYS